MEFLTQYGLFLLKSITVVIACLIVFAGFFSMSRKPKPKLEVISLNEHYDNIISTMNKKVLGEKPPKKKKIKTKSQLFMLLIFMVTLKPPR